jgi:hypothetical protein
MERQQPPGRSFVTHVQELILIAVALGAGYFSRDWFNHQQPEFPATLPALGPSYDPNTAFPRIDAPRPPEPTGAEPRAIAARAQAIHRDAEALANECRAAGGDWDKWQRETEPFRAALKNRVMALKNFEPASLRNVMNKYEPLEGRDRFPLFEVASREQLRHLYDPASLASFRKERSVVAASRWLREHGIDLIFVPVPKMTEIYVEHFLDPCPANGIIAPHVRRTLLELLEQDVEVVDAFPLFRALRDPVPDYLYNSADSHWAPRAMRIVAREVANRIARYRFGATALYALPIVKCAAGDYQINPSFALIPDEMPIQNGWQSLTDAQRKLAAPVQTRTLNHVLMLDGSKPPDDPQSPVRLIGHSYVPNFREQLIRELNQLISTDTSDDQTTESFINFLRDPELLAHCRVLVWITTEYHMTRFRPMPKPILAALQDARK